jgi:hypothetical protein
MIVYSVEKSNVWMDEFFFKKMRMELFQKVFRVFQFAHLIDATR